jgi:hypothetical protein
MTLSLYKRNTKKICFVGFSILIDRSIEKETLLRTSPHSSISSSSWSPILSPLKHDLRYHFRKKDLFLLQESTIFYALMYIYIFGVIY